LTNQKVAAMSDRRMEIIKAGLETLREFGPSGFTQQRVATRADMRQSHLTYYYPTRVDLLAAVARAAIDGQLAAADMVLATSSIGAAATAISKVVVRHENTRVLMALAGAADQEPRLRELFRELADGIVERICRFLKSLNSTATEVDARTLHALSVGLAVVDLATGRKDGQRRAAAILKSAILNITKQAGSRAPATPQTGEEG
jgi:AcrR family transcriptional regulator